MADYENLLDSIDAVIKSNNRREITGQILQNTLHQMVGSLGENYQLAGFATPTLDPNSPDQNVFYVTDEAGVYTNFDNITLGNGLSFLMWKNGAWSSKTMNIVTAQWVNDNFVSKAFLRQMFRAYDEDGVEIFANDTTSIIDNIKAMCGLWTNQYLSALGLGADGGGGASTLAGLNDVNLNNLQDGQALVYDLATNHWVNRTIQSGVDMSVVWAALAAATNEQINVSHLTTALSGYVTSTALATTLANYVTSTALAAALADYATQSWVETNYVSKSFFNSLFQAEDSEGNAIVPNNSGQTAIDRLKILVGAYTDQYLSALGLSEDAGASSYLYGLGDVQLDTQTLAGGQALVYSAALGKWTNGEAGVNMAQVWTALATADSSKQIDASHISTALASYVTSSSLATTLASYVTTSSLSATLADYVTSTALSTTLADYGTKSWVNNNYVSIAFFNRLFRAFAPVAEGESETAQVEPNDVTTEIDNIKAMFGLWTEQYLSALGLGSDAGHTIGVLNDLNDVTITNPQNDQVLKYNNGIWVNAAAPSGATALSGLTDVAISSLADKDLLQWDYASGKWKNVVLSTVMSGYATTSQLADYLPLSGGTISGGINPNADSTINLGTATAKYHYIYAHRLIRLQSIAKGDTYDSYKLDLPDKSGTIAVTSDLASYLPLSGGELSLATIDALTIKKTINEYSYIKYTGLTNSTNTLYGYIGCNGVNNPSFRNTSGYDYTIWHEGNDGSGSGLDADLLDGHHGSYYATASSLNNYLPLSGGTLTNSTFGSQLIIERSGSTNAAAIGFKNSNGILGYIGLKNSPNGSLYRWRDDYVDNYKIWDESNDGAGSGLDADLLDGHESSYFATATTRGFTINGVNYGVYSPYTTDVDLDAAYVKLTSTEQTIESTIPTLDRGVVELYRSSGNHVVMLGFANKISGGSKQKLGYIGFDGSVGGLVYRNTNSTNYSIFHAGNYTSWINTNNFPGLNSVNTDYRVQQNITSSTNTALRPLICGASYSTSDSPTFSTTTDDVYACWAIYTKPSNGDLFLHSASGASPTLWFKRSVSISPSVVNWGIYSNSGYMYFFNQRADVNSPTIALRLGYDSGIYASDFYTPLNVQGNIYATGGITALSDIRHKTIVEDTRLQVSDIASMRAVRYIWDDGREDKGIHVGSIAQDWQQILPEVVLRANNDEGTLSLQYGVAALISSITIARKVVDHEQRITELERENADLKQAYSFIKNAYDYLKMDYEQLKLKIA